MKPILPIALPILCLCAMAQNPAVQVPPGQGQAPRGTQQIAPVPKPGELPAPNPLQTVLPRPPGGTPINLTYIDALDRARQYSQQVYTASFAALLAHEDAVQAKAALLPAANHFSQFIYTQPNGTPSGVFVSNDGPHVYNNQLIVHGEIYNPVKLADYRRTLATEILTRAKADLAARGLIATVTQNYYGMVAAQRKVDNARLSLDEAQQFLDITQKLERGGEAAHVDVIKAQLQVQQRERESLDAQAAYDKARIALGILVFPNYGQAYNVADDLESAVKLPTYPEIQRMAGQNSPDIRVAQATVEQQSFGLTAARAAYLPALSFDYFYGINANQFALHNREGMNLLGSVVQAQVTVPLWNWGATRSKIKQAQLQVRQARLDLSLAQRTLLSEVESFYVEAQAAEAQLASLKSSLDLAAENLRLTRLRYTAGESTAQEVVDAQTGLVQARSAYDDGLVRYRMALASLQTLTGTF
jgi:outer membrane protein TolC